MFGSLFVCDERRGTKIRRVEEVEPSDTLERYLRYRLPDGKSPLKTLDLIWSKSVRIFLVDNVGMMMKGPFDWNGLPDVHVVFWDRILNGREIMCRSMARRIADDAGAKGVFTATPKDALTVIAFAKRIGFSQVSAGNGVIVMVMLFT